MTEHAPHVVDGEVVGRVRPAPRSPLDPDAHGRYPTALRPVPTELIDRPARPTLRQRIVALLGGER